MHARATKGGRGARGTAGGAARGQGRAAGARGARGPARGSHVPRTALSIKYPLLHSREMITLRTQQLVCTSASIEHRRTPAQGPTPCVVPRRTPSPPSEQREPTRCQPSSRSPCSRGRRAWWPKVVLRPLGHKSSGGPAIRVCAGTGGALPRQPQLARGHQRPPACQLRRGADHRGCVQGHRRLVRGRPRLGGAPTLL